MKYLKIKARACFWRELSQAPKGTDGVYCVKIWRKNKIFYIPQTLLNKTVKINSIISNNYFVSYKSIKFYIPRNSPFIEKTIESSEELE